MHFRLIYNNSPGGLPGRVPKYTKTEPFLQIPLLCINQMDTMSTRLVIDSSNELQEQEVRERTSQPVAVRIIANILSYIFHPVFVPVYVMLFMIYVHPYIFLGVSARDKILTLAQSVLMYSFFPLVTVLLLKALNFISSLHLRTQRERMIPLLATMTWSFWMWNVWKNLAGSPHEIVVFSLAVFLATIVAWLMNIYFKVSLHAISMGVMAGFILYLAFAGSVNFGIYISVAMLIAGVVCSARLIVSDHSPAEIYAGFSGGVIALLVAAMLA